MGFQQLSRLNTNQARIFYIFLFIKILIAGFISSEISYDLFYPFINKFLEGLNPYSYALEIGRPELFPYPALMLYIESFPVLFLSLFEGQNIPFFNNLFIKLPVLFADIILFIVILGWLNKSQIYKHLFLHWASPLLIYISYIHGQLDALPIAFLFLSLDSLFRKNFIKAFFLFGVSLSLKTMVAAIVPFYILFLANNQLGINKIAGFALVIIVIFMLFNSYFLVNPAFYEVVFLNSQQFRIFDYFVTFGNTRLYLLPMAFLVLLAVCFSLKILSRDTFLMFLGFSFGIFLLLMVPSPGWYYWLIPFLFYFFTKSGFSIYPAFLIQFFYLLYFVELDQFIPIVGIPLKELLLSLLQISLLICCFYIYKNGFLNFSDKKLLSSPLMVGIGGDSGVGKTTLSEYLHTFFGISNSLIIRGDDSHKWSRNDDNWKKFTHLDPKANNIYHEQESLKDLSKGRSVQRRFYDHSTGNFSEEFTIRPKGLIIYDGLHPFFLSKVREIFDFKVFINPDPLLQAHWKIKRDSSKRGYTKQQVLNNLESRKNDSKQFIESQSAFADLIINLSISNKDFEPGNDTEPQINYNLSLSNNYHVEPLIEEIIQSNGDIISHSYSSDGSHEIIIDKIHGNLNTNSIMDLFFNDFEQISLYESSLDKSVNTLIILIISYCIFQISNESV